MGREGAALRDQEHHAAARRAGGDGEADARRAGEARGDPDVRRPRDAAINNAEGEKQQVIKASEARRQQQINEAEGQAAAILAVAQATAEGIRQVAEAIRQPGGVEATQLRVAEQYVAQFGELAQKTNTLILPANVADIASMVALAMKVFREVEAENPE